MRQVESSSPSFFTQVGLLLLLLLLSSVGPAPRSTAAGDSCHDVATAALGTDNYLALRCPCTAWR
jgi:hypothetical protein